MMDNAVELNPTASSAQPLPTSSPSPSPSKLALDVSDLRFGWRDPKGAPLHPTDVLEGVNLRVEFGQLGVVRGTVGAGKSTLLLAILGEVEPQGGKVAIPTDCPVYYAPQSPWVFSGSIRDNILFGSLGVSEKVYRATVTACQLVHDLMLLDGGDGAMVGERGITLSGGQKARLSLARAVCAASASPTPAIVLLDDPFSAVDASVGDKIYQQVVRGLLRRHAVIVVTHHMRFGDDADVLLNLGSTPDPATVGSDDGAAGNASVDGDGSGSAHVNGKGRAHTGHGGGGGSDTSDGDGVDRGGGSIGGNSNVTEGGKNGGGDSVITDGHSDNQRAAVPMASVSESHRPLPDGAPRSSGWQPRKKSSAVISVEHRKVGELSKGTYWTYVTSSGPPWAIAGAATLLVGTQVLQTYMELSLAQWAQDSEDAEINNNAAAAANSTSFSSASDETSTLSILFATFLVVLVVRSLVYMHLAVSSSRQLHNRAFVGMIGTALRFFDTQPVGRILNRFSKDLDYIDDLMPDTGMDTLQLGLQCLAVCIIVCFVDPFIILAVLPAILLFVAIRWLYLQTSREVKRIEGIARSPLYAHLGMTVDGLIIVRSFPGAAARSLARFAQLHDVHTMAWLTYVATGRWLGQRLDLIVAMLAVIAAFSAVAQRDKIGAGVAGLSLAYTTQLAGIFQWTLRQSAELENQLTAVERLGEYAKLPPEDDFVGCAGALGCRGCGGARRDKGAAPWTPTNGAIEFDNVKLWYSDPGTPVLHGVNLRIAGGSKVGVVGRTGAGKSSLIAALLRLAPTSGTILVDGVPTCSLPLGDLRRAFTLIPQDPALFAGTVRKNLDPFHQCDDAELWSALESAQLLSAVKAVGGLNARVAEAGSNFSVGERQLICLARAVLRPTKLLLLDEATANVDMKTDAIIQRVIRDRFADCTVITIAHRLNTVLDSDYILVMDAGKAVEYGRPNDVIRVTETRLSSFGIIDAAPSHAPSSTSATGSASSDDLDDSGEKQS